jgi:hypothetical protein
VARALGTLLRRRDAEVVLVLHDLGLVERHCPALMDLLQSFAPRFRVLRSDDRLRSHARGMVIADDRVVLRRPQFGQPVTIVDYDDTAIAQAGALFEEMLASTIPGLSSRTTGL